MAIGRAMTDTYSVGHSGRSSLKQSPGGRRVAGINFIIAGLNVNNYKAPFLPWFNFSLDPFPIDGLSFGGYLPRLAIPGPS